MQLHICPRYKSPKSQKKAPKVRLPELDEGSPHNAVHGSRAKVGSKPSNAEKQLKSVPNLAGKSIQSINLAADVPPKNKFVFNVGQYIEARYEKGMSMVHFVSVYIITNVVIPHPLF